VAEQATNPVGESAPRTDRDIGRMLNGFFPPEAGEQDIQAQAIPDEGTIAGDDDEVEEASDGEDAEPDDEETSPEPFALPLKVSGKEIVIGSKEEAIELAQKGMHYTQEMQRLRDEQQRFTSEREQLQQGVRQQVDQYATALQTLSATYGHVLGNEAPDWNSAEMLKLKAEKPQEYVDMRDQWDQLGAIRSELSRIQQERQAEQQKQWQTWVANEQRALADKVPEWTDAARRQQDWTLITSYAQSIGIQAEELSSVFDHRQWLILRDAARYRQAETAGKKKVGAVKSPTVAPGSGRNVNQGNRQLNQARERLRQTGDPRAAGDIFQTLMTPRK
jgi:hypothetical protein